MADNTTLNTGTGGDIIATDDVAGVKYQRVKLVDGTADSTAAIPGDATNGLDVDVTREPATAADGGSLPALQKVVSGYDGTNTQVITTDASGRLVVVDGGGSLSVDDNGGSLTVDGTVAVSGTVAVTDNSGSLTVDAPVGTPAFVRLSDGTSAITTLPVSAASLPLPTGAATAAKQPAIGTAGSASADVITVQGVTSMTALKVDGSGVTQPVSGTVTASGPLTDTQLRATAVPVSGTVTASGPLTDTQLRATAVPVSLATLPALVAGSAAIGNVGELPVTSGGLTTNVTISAGSTNATSVKASAGQLYFVMVSNINAAVRYLKFYNKASSPTVGTDTPVQVYAVPGNTAGAGAVIPIPTGLAFGTGIAFALTTGVANSDTGAVAANELVVNLGYK